MDVAREFKSRDSGEEYTLWFTFEGKFQKCSCPHWQNRIRRVGTECKHPKQLREHDAAQLLMQNAIMKHFEKNWVLDFAAELNAPGKPDAAEDVQAPLDGAVGF